MHYPFNRVRDVRLPRRPIRVKDELRISAYSDYKHQMKRDPNHKQALCHKCLVASDDRLTDSTARNVMFPSHWYRHETALYSIRVLRDALGLK